MASDDQTRRACKNAAWTDRRHPQDASSVRTGTRAWLAPRPRPRARRWTVIGRWTRPSPAGRRRAG